MSKYRKIYLNENQLIDIIQETLSRLSYLQRLANGNFENVDKYSIRSLHSVSLGSSSGNYFQYTIRSTGFF